jgi:hypothetical protein
MWFSLAASFWLYFMLHPPEYIKYGSGKWLTVGIYAFYFCPYLSLQIVVRWMYAALFIQVYARQATALLWSPNVIVEMCEQV